MNEYRMSVFLKLGCSTCVIVVVVFGDGGSSGVGGGY